MRRTEDALLERMIRKAESTPHPSPFDRKVFPFYEGPWFNTARAAVESLQNPAEIREFMRRYAEHTQKTYGLSPEEAGRTTREAVGYCTGYVDDEQANIWFRSVLDICHPVMGRKRPFVIDGELEAYYLIGRSEDDEVPQYVLRNLSHNLLGLEPTKPPIIRGKDNRSYFAIRVLPSTGFTATQGYLFLRGFVEGISTRMREEIGKECNIVCEVAMKDERRK